MKVKVVGKRKSSKDESDLIVYYERDTELSQSLIIDTSVLNRMEKPKVYINFVSKYISDFLRLSGQNWLDWEETEINSSSEKNASQNKANSKKNSLKTKFNSMNTKQKKQYKD